MSRRAALLGIFILVAVVTAGAQDAQLHGTGGEIRVIGKKSASLSGSLGVSVPSGDSAYGLGNRYSATLGGTVVKDRVWFFASAEQGSMRIDPISSGRFGANAVDAKVMASLSDRQTLTTLFGQQQTHSVAAPGLSVSTPSSFLSMRYTGLVSDNMFFSASVSRRTGVQPGVLFAPEALD